ncbi:MAG: SecDF P1 head subdomain-containing protein [Alphaproteobacteria bacterium]
MALPAVRLQASGEMLFLSSELIADSSNIQSACVENTPLGRALTIILDSSGATTMKGTTSLPSARRLGMIIDGTLAFAPMIREPISDVFHVMVGNLSAQELDRVADLATSFRSLS